MKKIAVLGPANTFSDYAATKYNVNHNFEKSFYPSIDEAVYSLEEINHIAVVPVENTLDGYVQRTLDLLLEMNLKILEEVYVPVQFSLVANTEKLEDIDTIYVQFKSKGQCTNLFKKMSGVKVIITESNMESYNLVKKKGKGAGAIIPQHVYNPEEFQFGIKNVTDSFNNYTRFLVVEKRSQNTKIFYKDMIKVSLYIVGANDEPGVLNSILQRFYEKKINLVSIMSRPTKKKIGKYNFFIELQGNFENKKKIEETIQEISKKYNVKVLGLYS